MYVVKLLVPVPRAKKEGKDRVFGTKKKDDRELGERKEACAVGVVNEWGVDGYAKQSEDQVCKNDGNWYRKLSIL